MISPKQKQLNDMIDTIIRFTQQNEVDCLLIAAAPVESGEIEVKTAVNCKDTTAHFFGHAIAELKDDPQPAAALVSQLVIGGIACASIGDFQKLIAQAQAKTETCH